MKVIKSREQIAKEYSINVRTLYRWISKKFPDLLHVTLTPRYQKMIYEEFGYPPNVNFEKYAHIII
jgi:hypothetical protein